MDVSGKTRAGLLIAGALAGLLAALFAILSPGPRHVPADAIAVVNGQPISRADLDLALAAFENDRRQLLTGEDRKFVFTRLIDEELLLQQALALGLARDDRALRNSLVRTLIDSLAADSVAAQPDDDTLRAFLDENRPYFQQPAQMQVVHLFAPSEDEAAQRRLQPALQNLRGGMPLAGVQVTCDCPPPLVLPDSPVSESILRRLLSPLQVEQVLPLEAGQATDVLIDTSGHHVFVVQQRVAEHLPPFTDIRDQIADEWRRRAADDALRAYLTRLWRQADIDLADDAPRPEND